MTRSSRLNPGTAAMPLDIKQSSNRAPYMASSLGSSIRAFKYSPTIQCQQCPCCKEDVPVNAMKRHMSRYHWHGEELPFHCSLCGKGFYTQPGLQLHMQAHKGRTFNCPICSSGFKQKAHLKNHLEKVHKLAQCKRCLNTFHLGPDFNQHLLTCG